MPAETQIPAMTSEAITMLYLLEIENFYSIRTKQIVDLRIGEAVGGEPGRFDHLFPGSEERAARVVAFFGPNASGKSTVLKALAFIGWFTSNSFQLPPERRDCPVSGSTIRRRSGNRFGSRSSSAVHWISPRR